MVSFKRLLKATRKKIIGLVLIGIGAAGLITLIKDWFMKLIESFTLAGSIIVFLVMIIIGIYLNLKDEENS